MPFRPTMVFLQNKWGLSRNSSCLVTYEINSVDVGSNNANSELSIGVSMTHSPFKLFLSSSRRVESSRHLFPVHTYVANSDTSYTKGYLLNLCVSVYPNYKR